MSFKQRFSIRGAEYDEGAPSLQAALAAIHNTTDRPLCLCMAQGVEMYVAKYADYVIKRLPDTGSLHHPSCVAYEMDATESGRGGLIGKAITEHASNEWEIRTKFALTRTPGRAIQRGAAGTPTEVAARPKGASMLALLHELWERTGFNKWYPAMEGKRSWGTVRWHLLQEAAKARTKNQLLSEVVLSGEPFDKEKAAEQEAARKKSMTIMASPKGDVQNRMMIALGEFKSAEASTLAWRLRLKHMPEIAFLIEPDTWKRVRRTYERQLQVHEADPSTRLVVAALVYSPADQVVCVGEITLMLTTQHWIPIEDANDNELIRRLVEAKRRFIRPLRFDSKHWGAFANAKLLDAGDAPVSLHIMSERLDPVVKAAKEEVLAGQPGTWVWTVPDPMPALPEVVVRRGYTRSPGAKDATPSAMTSSAGA